MNPVLKQSLGNMFNVALLSALSLGIILLLVPVVTLNGEIRKKRLFAILLGTLGLAQIFCGYVNIAVFQKEYIDIAMENTSFSARIIQKDINLVLGKGVSYREMWDIDNWLDSIVGTIKEIESVSIHNAAGEVLYAAPAPGEAGYLGQPATVFTTTLSLDRSLSGDQGNLRVALSKAYVDTKVKDLKLDVLTIIVTSSFLTVELILFLLFFIRMHAIRSDIDKPAEEETFSTADTMPSGTRRQ